MLQWAGWTLRNEALLAAVCMTILECLSVTFRMSSQDGARGDPSRWWNERQVGLKLGTSHAEGRGASDASRPTPRAQHFFCRLEQEHTRFAERASALFVTKQSFLRQRSLERQAMVNGGKCSVVLLCNEWNTNHLQGAHTRPRRVCDHEAWSDEGDATKSSGTHNDVMITNYVQYLECRT